MTPKNELVKRLPNIAMEVVNYASEKPDFFLLVRNEINTYFMEPRNNVRLESLSGPEKAQVAHDLMVGLIQNEETKTKVSTPLDRVKLAVNSLKIDKDKVRVWTLTLSQIINKIPSDPQFQVLFENVKHKAQRSGTESNVLMSALDIFRDRLESINLQDSTN